MSDSLPHPTDAFTESQNPQRRRTGLSGGSSVAATKLVDGVDTCVIFSDGSTILLKGVVRFDGSFLRG